MIRRRVVVHGLVQGVYFRAATRERAQQHRVAGWVRNRPDALSKRSSRESRTQSSG